MTDREERPWIVRMLPALRWAALALVLVSLLMVFLYVPADKQLGDIQRIFYYHVASAWNAFFAFFIVFVSSIAYLATGKRHWDRLSVASAEIGVIFTTVVLLTGPIWGRVSWGKWWDWDPRLTTTLVLWFIYVAYLVIRAAVGDDTRRARFAAVFGIIGFVDVPIVFMSVRWWRTIHPTVIYADKMELEPSMVVALVLSVVTFTVLYGYLLGLRYRVAALADEVNEFKQRLRDYR